MTNGMRNEQMGGLKKMGGVIKQMGGEMNKYEE